MKIYSQPIIRRKWSVTNPSKAMIILHRITFGFLGAIPMTDLREDELMMYFTGPPTQDIKIFPHIISSPINCRCSMVNFK